jgi:hypothetical protein
VSKAKGTRNEHKTVKYLEAIGYCCTRAAGSLGLWDIIAISRSQVKLIQVKSNRWPPPHEREALELFECPVVPNRQRSPLDFEGESTNNANPIVTIEVLK